MVTGGRSFPQTNPLSGRHRLAERKPLTLVLACKSKDGIVMMSDTRKTELDEDDASDFEVKIFNIGKRYAIGCAGISADIEDFIDYLTNTFAGNDRLLTHSELFAELRKTVRLFQKQKRLEAAEADNKYSYLSFDFTGLFAAPVRPERDPNERFVIYRILLKNIPLYPDDGIKSYERFPDGVNHVEKMGLCKSVGSGARAANSMLNSVVRFLGVRKIGVYDLSYEAVMMLCYMITGSVAGSKWTVGGGSSAKLITEAEPRPVREDEFRRKGENNLIQLSVLALRDSAKLRTGALREIAAVIRANKAMVFNFLAAVSKDKELKAALMKYRPMLVDFLNGLKEDDTDQQMLPT